MAGAKPAPQAEAAAPKRSMLPFIAAALVLLLVGGGGAAWFFMFRGAGRAEAKPEPASLPPEHVIKAGTVVVNVSGTEGRRYLRTSIEIGTDAKHAKHVEELRGAILDRAIHVLGAKSLEELLQPDERDAIRDELRESINEAIGHGGKGGKGEHGPVSHVFLTEFIIQ
ncbi:MAG: flagellar basal body-associated FliL family protein [Candidatus Rokubacteria bacterium]|nr:flagellar basal body-associated FliL family protein [Candidatus Rokubacteria bacterium]